MEKSLKNDDIILRPVKKEILKIIEKKIVLKNISFRDRFFHIRFIYFKKKYNCKIEGVEPSSKACKFAKEKYNIKIINKTF